MRLYVCGEESGDPSTWTSFTLVLAESPEQAKALGKYEPITEVDMSKAALLCEYFEQDYRGEDA